MKRFRNTDYYVSEDGGVFRKGKELKKQMIRLYKDGKVVKEKYYQVFLQIEKKTKCFTLQKLVAEVYVPNPNNYEEVDHLDNNRFNNHYTNLEWVTGEENRKRGKDDGIMGHKLTDDDVKFIRENYKYRDKEYNSKTLGVMYGVHPLTIMRVVKGVSYKEVV